MERVYVEDEEMEDIMVDIINYVNDLLFAKFQYDAPDKRVAIYDAVSEYFRNRKAENS